MKKRIGNDISLEITLKRVDGYSEGEPILVDADLSNAVNLKVSAYLQFIKDKFEVPFSRVDNVFNIVIPASFLKIGKHNIIIEYQEPDASIEGGFASVAWDKVAVFEVVDHSEEETEGDTEITAIVNYSTSGATFTPTIAVQGEEIILSWSNDKGLTNPDPVILNEGIPEAVLAANEAATAANNAATLANEKAGYANTQGDYAKEQGELAQTAREGIEGDLAAKIDKSSITSELGDSEELVMSQKGVKDEVQKLQLADTEQSHSIKLIEDTLNSININQEATAEVEGYQTVSLPKTAANAGMAVKLEGQSALNLFANGDFRNGLTGWDTSLSEYTYAVASGILTATRVTDGDYVVILRVKGGETPPNSVMYTRYRVRVLQAGATFISVIYAGVVNNIISSPNANQWYDVIDRYATGSSTGIRSGIRVMYPASQALTGYAVEVEYGMQLNLTAAFGAGNEPTVEECDAMFADYFEGVKSFEPTGRVRSVDALGLNPTNLYLQSPILRSNGLVKDEIRKGSNGYELVKRVGDLGEVLAEPVITPIPYAGLLNSNSNGTVYHEPYIADAGVYDNGITIQSTDYPISEIEKIIKWENGVEYLLDVADAVIAIDGLSFTHPDLADGDLVMFTYAYDLESTVGKMTLTHYDSRYVIADTANGKFYKHKIVSTNGVPTIELEEV
jgi:hypothetical protein